MGKDGYTLDDVLVHDAHCEDNTLQLKLALMGNGDGFPVALRRDSRCGCSHL